MCSRRTARTTSAKAARSMFRSRWRLARSRGFPSDKVKLSLYNEKADRMKYRAEKYGDCHGQARVLCRQRRLAGRRACLEDKSATDGVNDAGACGFGEDSEISLRQAPSRRRRSCRDRVYGSCFQMQCLFPTMLAQPTTYQDYRFLRKKGHTINVIVEIGDSKVDLSQSAVSGRRHERLYDRHAEEYWRRTAFHTSAKIPKTFVRRRDSKSRDERWLDPTRVRS